MEKKNGNKHQVTLIFHTLHFRRSNVYYEVHLHPCCKSKVHLHPLKYTCTPVSLLQKYQLQQWKTNLKDWEDDLFDESHPKPTWFSHRREACGHLAAVVTVEEKHNIIKSLIHSLYFLSPCTLKCPETLKKMVGCISSQMIYSIDTHRSQIPTFSQHTCYNPQGWWDSQDDP